MATTKEIELILQARLEQGNAIDNAKALGAGISDALEHAFDGLGERIAAKMMMELKTSLGGLKLSELFDSSGMTGPQGAPQVQSQYSLIDGVWQGRQPAGGAITDINGTAISSQAARPQYGPSLPGGAEQAGTNVNNSDTGGSKDEPYRRKPRFGNNYSTGPFMGIEGPLTDSFSQAQSFVKKDRALDMDQVIAKFKAFDTLRKIDPEYKMDPALREQVGIAKKFAVAGAGEEAQSISKLAEEIVALQRAIELNSESVKAATSKKEGDRTSDEKGAVKDQSQRQADVFNKMDEVESRQQHMRDTENFTKKVSALESEESTTKMARGANIAKGIGLAGAAIGGAANFIGNLDQMRLDNSAGEAQLNNGNLRDFMGGDISSMLATQSLGGEDKLREDAMGNAKWKAFGKTAAGAGLVVGGVVGGAFSSPTGVGAVIGAQAAMGGAALAYSGIDDYMSLDKNAAAGAQAMKHAQMEKEKEFMMMSNASMGTSIGSYNTAQAMGSPEMSGFLYGAGGSQGIGNNSMRMRAVKDRGLSNAQFDSYNQNILSSMGGQFGTRSEFHAPMASNQRSPMEDSKLQATMLESMNLKNQGFTNIDQIQGSLFNQSQGKGDSVADRDRAMKEAAALYGEATAAGMDKLKIPMYLEQMASRMASTGFGSEGYDKDLMKRGLGATQAIYGTNGLEGKQVGNVQNVIDNIYDKARGNDTLSVVAGVSNVQNINKKLGSKLGSAEEIFLRTKKGDSENEDDVTATQKFFNMRKGANYTAEQTKKIMMQHKNNVAKETKNTHGFQDEQMAVLDIASGEQTVQGTMLYNQVLNDQADGKGKYPTQKPVIPKTGTNVGEGERKVYETAKADMLATGFGALASTVERVTGQMEAFHTTMQKYQNMGPAVTNSTGNMNVPFVPTPLLPQGQGKYLLDQANKMMNVNKVNNKPAGAPGG